MGESHTKGLSAAVLKNIAIITMTIDHITAILLTAYLPNVIAGNVYSNEWYTFGRIIGRIAFVLYAFMIAEGALRSRNRKKYVLRLLALALISTPVYSYVHDGSWFKIKTLNIFFLLTLGIITIIAYEWLKERLTQKSLSILACSALWIAACAVSEAAHIEYGLMGVLLIMAFYFWRYDFSKMTLSVTLVMSIGYILHAVIIQGGMTWINNHSADLFNSLIQQDRIQIFGLLAMPIIYFYKGSKGKQLPKWFYYLYYPAHLLLLGLIKQFVL